MATPNRTTSPSINRPAVSRHPLQPPLAIRAEKLAYAAATEVSEQEREYGERLEEIRQESRQEESQGLKEDPFEAEYLARLEKLRRSARALKEYSDSLRAQPSGGSARDVINEPQSDGSASTEKPPGDFSALRGKGLMESVFDFGWQLVRQPKTFARHYGHLAEELVKIVRARSELAPERGDRRFRDAVWQDNPFYRMVLQGYIAWDQEMAELIDDLSFEDERDRARAKFIFHQLSAAVAPSNSPLNPVAVKRAYQTGGKSVVAGLKNLLGDLQENHGMPRQITAEAYKVGKDLGNTEGAVVYRNPLFELIQYSCVGQTQVRERPVLIVPPQINKYYVFDLTPKNSLVDFLRRQGLQVFIVSWKNPTAADANTGLDSYLEELDKGVDAVLEITGSPDLNLVSACAGGITAVSLQALYAAQGETRVRHHSLLVTALSVEGHPTLDLFMSRATVAAALARSQRNGVMDGRELAHVFAWLRPTDLVWSYWINNNLLGKEPPNMDVLYWDNDSTRLPAALHRDFTDIMLNDRFAANNILLANQQLDLSKIEGDFYFLAGEDDYLMPWQNCFRNPTLFANANSRFVLSNSGHIQSVLRPPGIASSTYATNESLAGSAEEWRAGATTQKGSWWEDWSQWLCERSEGRKPAPKSLGSERYPPLCPSPGTYVLER